jgi:cytochrome c
MQMAAIQTTDAGPTEAPLQWPLYTWETAVKYANLMGALTLAAMAALAAAPAQANADLAKAKNCMACHAAATRLVGPSYKQIAARYRGQKDAPALLAAKVVKGGAGVWGPIPMPANPQVSEAEAKALVQWVLAQP